MKEMLKSAWDWLKSFGKNFLALFIDKAKEKVLDLLTDTEKIQWAYDEVATLWKRDDLSSKEKAEQFLADAKAKFPDASTKLLNLLREVVVNAYEETTSTTTTEA